MPQTVIEGTWEEIKRHDEELTGRQVRLTIKPDKKAAGQPSTSAKDTDQPKVLRARGMLAGLFSSEDYFREKREDMEREDRSLS